KRTDEAHRMWNYSSGGWVLHLVSAFSEWGVVMLYGLAFLTFVPEFRNIIIEDREVIVIEDQE
ncbi:hypothetical protein L9F63_021924, partial [Diploptera punctata]